MRKGQRIATGTGRTSFVTRYEEEARDLVAAVQARGGVAEICRRKAKETRETHLSPLYVVTVSGIGRRGEDEVKREVFGH